jgi:hypothetical protein
VLVGLNAGLIRETHLGLGIRLPEDGFEGFHDGCMKDNVLAEFVLCGRGSPRKLRNRGDLDEILDDGCG